jgi:two-component sensor histidine kinase
MSIDHSLTNEQLLLGLEVAGLGLGTVDYLNDTITLDQRAANLFDLPADVEISRSKLHSKIHPDDIQKIEHQLSALLDPDDTDYIDVEHRVVHGDGSILWLAARKKIKFSEAQSGEEPRPLSGLVAIQDVTPYCEAQQRAQFLLDELNHRTKNILSVVQSIARMTAANGDMSTFSERFGQRLRGLAHNHDALVRNNWSHVELEELLEYHLKAFNDQGKTRVAMSGPSNVGLKPEAAQAVSMAIHELATNASKYGALSSAEGHIDLNWQWGDKPESSSDLMITWQEKGGPEVSPPQRAGFGQRVVKDMAEASTGGRVDLDYRAAGLHWSLEIPGASLSNLI